MKFFCPNCKEPYSLNADLLLDKEQKIQCVKCKHQWTEIFLDSLIDDTGSVLERISKIKKQPLNESQILRVLRDEADFDKNMRKLPSNERSQLKYKTDSLGIKNQKGERVTNFLDVFYYLEFWLGFCLSILLFLMFFVVYGFADWISDTLPFLSDYLQKYVNFLDSIRIKISMIKDELINLTRQFLNY